MEFDESKTRSEEVGLGGFFANQARTTPLLSNHLTDRISCQ